MKNIFLALHNFNIKDTRYTWSQILGKFLNTHRIKNLNDSFLNKGP